MSGSRLAKRRNKASPVAITNVSVAIRAFLRPPTRFIFYIEFFSLPPAATGNVYRRGGGALRGTVGEIKMLMDVGTIPGQRRDAGPKILSINPERF